MTPATVDISNLIFQLTQTPIAAIYDAKRASNYEIFSLLKLDIQIATFRAQVLKCCFHNGKKSEFVFRESTSTEISSALVAKEFSSPRSSLLLVFITIQNELPPRENT